MTNTPTSTNHRRLQGVVVSNKMQSTTVVRVDRRVAHPKYGKYFTVSKRFKIHSPGVTLNLGDIVQFEECRPISRDKRWRYIATLKTAA